MNEYHYLAFLMATASVLFRLKPVISTALLGLAVILGFIGERKAKRSKPEKQNDE